MKLDRTLIDKEGVPTPEEIKAYHEKNDITVAGALYDPEEASDVKTAMFVKARDLMCKAWLKEMKKLGGKASFRNFTEYYPPMLLAVTDENLIAGKVGEILEDEAQISMLLDVGLNALEEPIMMALTAFSSSIGKELEELADDEVHTVVDKIATEFLNTMVGTLMNAQKVSEIIEASKETSEDEDFNQAIANNYSKMDHDKAKNHTRTEVGEILSLDAIMDDPESDFEPTVNALDNTADSGDVEIMNYVMDEENQKFINKFLKTLDVEDCKIFLLREKGHKQADIAMNLGYANHSVISKRLKKIYEKYKEFKKKNKM